MMTSKKKGSPRAATLADVGREAGVSIMSASAVLNGPRTSTRFSAKTRDRVLAAAARLRYRPNATARALTHRRMNTLGVAAVFDVGELNHYFLEIFNGVVAEAVRRNQNITVFALHDWDTDGARISTFCDGRIDGLILVAPIFTRPVAEQLPDHAPCVSLHANLSFPGTVNVESDEETGAYEMVTRLISLGHRRILHITGNRGWLGAERRIRGYKRALVDAGLPYDESLLVEAEFSSRAGREAWFRWIERSQNIVFPEAIFCANDDIAFGCLEAFAQMGLRVPEDISVVGFDDTLFARTSVPQLSTVRQPLRAMGSRAVEVLLEKIDLRNGGKATEIASPIVFPTEVIMRGSVAVRRSTSRVVTVQGRTKRGKNQVRRRAKRNMA